MLGEVMSMFAQLSGQHHKLISEIEVESEKTLEVTIITTSLIMLIDTVNKI